MKKYALIIFLILMSSFKGGAQADCFIKYSYSGKITLNNKSLKRDSISVLLPSLEFMLNIVDKPKGYTESKIGNGLDFEKEFVTIGSSAFCGTPDKIIQNLLKGSRSVYSIYILRGKTKLKRIIKVNDIAFIHKNGVFYITLPKIVI